MKAENHHDSSAGLMIMLLSFMALIRPAACDIEDGCQQTLAETQQYYQCVPQWNLIGQDGTSARCWCTNAQSGGEYAYSGWYDICYDASKGPVNGKCACSWVSTSWDSCQCGTYGQTGMLMCYQTPVKCGTCPTPGQYLFSCGCWLRSDGSQYDCDAGSCQPCPVGFYCPAGSVDPIPCPAGFMCPSSGMSAPTPCPEGRFVSATAATACNPCQLPQGYYRASGQQSSIKCNAVSGALDVSGAAQCTQCTPTNESSVDTGNTCPEYRSDFQYDSHGNCRQCLSCSLIASSAASSSNAAVVSSLPKYYVPNTGQPQGCVFDPPNDCLYTYVNLEGQLQTNTSYMPFILGKQRIKGSFAAGPGYADTPAYYQNCSTFSVAHNSLPIAGMQQRGAHLLPAGMQDGRCLLSAAGCVDDCNLGLVTECQPGYFARLLPETENGVPVLETCVPCPPNSKKSAQQGGLPTSCPCLNGYGTAVDLGKAFAGIASLPSSGSVLFWSSDNAVEDSAAAGIAVCYSCLTDVYIPVDPTTAAAGEYQQTAVKCYTVAAPPGVGSAVTTTTTTTMIQTAGPGQVLLGANQNFSSCPAGQWPAPNRRTCLTCEPGTACPFGADTPELCSGTTNFSDSAGAAECTVKNMGSCPPQHALSINTLATSDNDCVACPTLGCGGPGQYTVFASGHNASNPCGVINPTANTNLQTYVACWPASDASSTDLEVPFVTNSPNYRLTYALDANGDGQPTVEVEQCRDSLVPPYAEFVYYRPSSQPGKQCYFACQYGVQPDGAAKLRQLIKSKAYYGARPDLIPYLVVPAGQQDSASAAAVGSISTPLLWGDHAITNGLSQLYGADWVLTLRMGGAPAWASAVETNTFLLVDDIMAQLLLPNGSGYLPGKNISAICRSPAEANTVQCPPNFAPAADSSGDDDNNNNNSPSKCALEARTSLYNTGSLWDGGGGYGSKGYVVSTQVSAVDDACWAEDGSLSSFMPQCVTCMSILQQRLRDFMDTNSQAMDPYAPTTSAQSGYDAQVFSTAQQSLLLVQWWLLGSSWYDYLAGSGTNPSDWINPYVFQNSLYYYAAAYNMNTTLSQTQQQQQCQTFTCFSTPAVPVWQYTFTFPGGGGAQPITFSACVPCAKTQTLPFCEVYNGGNFAGPGACPTTGGTNNNNNNIAAAVVSDVCTLCSAKAGTNGPIAETTTAGYDWTNWIQVDGLRTSALWTDSTVIPCRYYCALNYTSNRDPKAYSATPCLPCSNATPACACASGDSMCVQGYRALDYPDGVASRTCGADNVGQPSYVTYQPQCISCAGFAGFTSVRTSQLVYTPLPRASDFYPSQGQCLALCNTSLYKTVLQDGTRTFTPVPQELIASCSPCTADEVCGAGLCLEGAYLVAGQSNTTCAACNTQPCAATDQYREGCPAGSTRDAECVDCDRSWLSVNVAAVTAALAICNRSSSIMAASPWLFTQLTDAIFYPPDATTRRWLSSSAASAACFNQSVFAVPAQRGGGPCYMACANNYVLLDSLTGMPIAMTTTTANAPHSSGSSSAVPPERLVCVACQSEYIQNGLGLSNTGLYSVWDASADGQLVLTPPVVRNGSALAQMAGRCGACCMCNSSLRDTEAGDDVMCNLRLGAGVQILGQTSSTSVLNPGFSVGISGSGGGAGVPNNNNNNTPAAPTTAEVANTLLSPSPSPPALSSKYLCCKLPPSSGGACTTAADSVLAKQLTLLNYNCSRATTAAQASAAGSQSSSPGGRRLLASSASSTDSSQTSGQNTLGNNNNTIQVKVKVQPIVSGLVQHFSCCSDVSSSPTASISTLCKQLKVKAYEFEKLQSGSDFKDYCAGQGQPSSSTHRRSLLLLTSVNSGEEEDLCLSGQYKDTRGPQQCSDCPAGASTGYPWNGVTSSSLCMCLPGYRAVRGPPASSSSSLIQCVECGPQMYLAPGMPEDVCQPCPAGMVTPPGLGASGYCYCPSGTYLPQAASSSALATTNPCLICDQGFYCDGSVRTQCPPHSSTSAAGMSSRGDCICDAGYFGSLAVPDQQCFPAPPALLCVSENGVIIASTASAGCTCAQGWTAQYRLDPVTQQQEQFCSFGCSGLGQYMKYDPVTLVKQSCVPCPYNTYSSSTQMLYVPSKPDSQQCTPCPQNYVTLTTGSVSLDACVCLSGLPRQGGNSSASAAASTASTASAAASTASTAASTASAAASTAITCGACPAGWYLEQTVCLSCPTGLTSPPASVGSISCVCPPGGTAFLSPQTKAVTCQPCPIGFYSPSAGASCTPCPQGQTTAAVGQTSVMACVCEPGTVLFGNVCRATG